jgi:serine protease Do
MARQLRFPRFGLGIVLAASIAMSVAFPPASARAEDRRTPIVRAIEAASPAVVNLHGQKTVRATNSGGEGGPFKQVNGMGTGILIDPRGFLLTNYHVVEDVNEIRATLSDGTSTTAEIVGYDVTNDLAVLQLRIDQPVPTIPLGTSSDLMLGETVIAIGNPFGYEHTITTGIISQLHREVKINDTQEYRDLIQTNTEINPGNSGGPLLNIDGNMVGMVVAVRVGAQGIAFAIPVDDALEMAARIIERTSERPANLGIAAKSKWTGSDWELEVVQVDRGGPAAEHLVVGDRLQRIDGQAARTHLDLALAILDRAAGERMELEVQRDGQPHRVAFDLSDAPAELVQQNRVWNSLGIEVTSISEAQLRKLKSNHTYSGGLKVTRVRTGSPAQRQGIRIGDVLVGIHKWSTVKPADLEYILRESESLGNKPAEFFIVRSGETLVGRLQLATESSRRISR